MSKRISSGKAKKGAQKHQNSFAFTVNKNSPQALKIAATPVYGLCLKCNDIIDWRKRMGRYKPLSQPKTCARCSIKAITGAYHVICTKCARKDHVCAKCLEKKVLVVPESDGALEALELVKTKQIISTMTERQRRSYLRKLERGDDEAANKLKDNIELSDEDDFTDSDSESDVEE